jgi:hypothetical protein
MSGFCKEKMGLKKYNNRFFAVLIGINYKNTDAELNGCINDVKKINSFLKSTYKLNPSNIHILTEEEASSSNQPTKDNILRELRWLVSKAQNAKRKTCLFLHYSGHGSYVWDRSGDDSDGKDETICPLDYDDAGMITDDDFRKLVVEPLSPNPKVKMTVLLDCCHSGTGFDLHYNYKIMPSSKSNVYYYRVGQDKNYEKTRCKILCFSGCKDKQYSADALIGGIYQGAMTHSFIRTLKKFGIGRKVLRRRKLTYKKMIGKIQTYLKDRNYEQIPQLSSSCYVNLKQQVSFN